MNKMLKKIWGIVLMLIVGYQQFAYADVIDTRQLLYVPVASLIAFIAVLVLFISAISFFCLKLTEKKIAKESEEKVKTTLYNDEIIKKEKNHIQRNFYIWGMILSIVLIIGLNIYNIISSIVMYIVILLFVASIIVRLNKNKKLSNCIYFIAIICTCIMLVFAVISIDKALSERAVYDSELSDIQSSDVDL